MTKRQISVDYLRTIGIVLMVLAHIPINKAFVHYVHAFHMPLFFVISGYLNNKNDFERLKKTIKKMLVPYFIFSLLGYILWYIEIKPITLNEILSPIKAIFFINSNDMPIVGALWFLTAMIFVNIFVFGIENQKIFKSKKMIIIFIFLIGLFETKIFTHRLPWSIGAACVGTGFFYFGIWMKKFLNYDWIKKLSMFWYILIIIIISFSISFNETINMRLGNYGCIVQTVFNSIFAIIILWIVIMRITPFLESKIHKKITSEIKSIGQYSIIYLCCNEIVINIIKSILNKINLYNIYLTIILVGIGLKICEKIFTKTNLKKIVGIK